MGSIKIFEIETTDLNAESTLRRGNSKFFRRRTEEERTKRLR